MPRRNSTTHSSLLSLTLQMVSVQTVAVSMWPANWIKLFRTFPQSSRNPQLPTLSHCYPPHTNQAVPYLSSAQSVPTVTNTVTLLPSTHKTAQMLSCALPTVHFQKFHFASSLSLPKGRTGTGRKRSKPQIFPFRAYNKCSVFPCNFVL